MGNCKRGSRIIFSVNVNYLQGAAVERIGRKLTCDELHTARKGIEAGLSFDIDTVVSASIEEAVERNREIIQ